MCGICGILSSSPRPHSRALMAMSRAQAHRGPDGVGFYLDGAEPAVVFSPDELPDTASRVALAHQRLAILDPSSAGRQPMISPDGRLALVFNGEIYNFRELRRELRADGTDFRTDTDTEVLLHLYSRDPEHPERWLSRLNGIFAFALWDRAREELLLARDPFGVKPLHFASEEGCFRFGSEIKSLLAAGWRPRLNRAALHLFMNVRYVPGNETLFQGVERLPPGTCARVRDGHMSTPLRFYELPGSDPAQGEGDVPARMGRIFHESVERQLLSDAPLGMALSGGLDSGMIVAAASRLLRDDADLRLPDRICRTFTLGFHEPNDENEAAAAVAEHFGSLHTDRMLDLNPLARARDVIRAVEEPKINMLQGYELAGMVREHVKVLFSGLGGDELFAGYDIHRFCNTLGHLHRFTPAALQKWLLAPVGGALWHLQSRSGFLRTEHYRIGAQILLSAGDRAGFYTRLRNAWDGDAGMYARVYARPDDFRDFPTCAEVFRPHFESDAPYLEQVLRAEFQEKMVNDFLVNEDRNTSAHGVEGRVPFLDRELVDAAFRLPAAQKMRGRQTKAIWREVARRDLPAFLLERKKQGFTFSSYHQWQKDLRGVVEARLTRGWCEETGLFSHDFVRSVLNAPPHPNLRWHYFMVWMMLGVQDWLEVFDVEL